MSNLMDKNSSPGLTLVEVMIATAIILTFLVALIGTYNTFMKMAFASTDIVKAAYLAEEGIEVVKFLRNSSWEGNILTLSPEVDYNLTFENNLWQATTTSIFIDGIFERKIIFSEVYRDPSAQIVSSGGTLDPDTRMVTAIVSWKRGAATTTKSIPTYITNLSED
ncbi:MAG: prepilin-type N-terminal cleavage/methylation domain-containing protein [Candidatus Zambryskibacteria bacterium]|nr:prepilin-type N-terminal cleavage/methylation domain-containing protein [Candidatus Zambryskibacteria bacterium]